jgi:hypothetical protein
MTQHIEYALTCWVCASLDPTYEVTAIPYEVFRNLLVDRMAEEGYQPPGMKRVIDRILAA